MNEQLEQAMLCVADIGAIAQGLAVSLDGMEEELAKDARYYVLRTCIEAIVEKSERASEAPDACPSPRAGGPGA